MDVLDIIFGKLSLHEIISEEKIYLNAVRNKKICGLTIIFNVKSILSDMFMGQD